MLDAPPANVFMFTVAVVLALAVLLNIMIEAICDAWDEYKLESRQRMMRLDGRK